MADERRGEKRVRDTTSAFDLDEPAAGSDAGAAAAVAAAAPETGAGEAQHRLSQRQKQVRSLSCPVAALRGCCAVAASLLRRPFDWHRLTLGRIRLAMHATRSSCLVRSDERRSRARRTFTRLVRSATGTRKCASGGVRCTGGIPRSCACTLLATLRRWRPTRGRLPETWSQRPRLQLSRRRKTAYSAALKSVES